MTRKCRHCKSELPKVKDSNPVQAKGFCSFDHMARHGLEKAKASREKRERKELRQRKEAIKTRAEHMREAQTVFNAFIRARDEVLPCISCGTYTAGQFHAGHYRTTKAAPELRFEELNCHKQCAQCNNFDSGNIVEYRLKLVERIGPENLAWLEGPHEPKKYTIEELRGIKARYRRMTRELKRKAA